MNSDIFCERLNKNIGNGLDCINCWFCEISDNPMKKCKYKRVTKRY